MISLKINFQTLRFVRFASGKPYKTLIWRKKGMVINMKKVFNKSAAYGLVFAISSCWLYYFFIILSFISFPEYLFPPFIRKYIGGDYMGVAILSSYPICFVFRSIPAYFLLRCHAENKTVFNAFSMFLSIIFQIPLYIFVELFIQGTGGGFLDLSGIMRAIIFAILLSVIIVTFIICTADIIISMIKQRVFSIPRILVILTSGIMISSIIFILNEIEGLI